MVNVVFFVICGATGQMPVAERHLTPLFDAIRMVETGAEARPENAIGDGGKSLGPYQISRKYLIDSGIGGDWSRCRDRRFSEVVMIAYWKRHCPDALRTGDFEKLARIHNGGPNGYKKAATLSYWRMVQGILNSEQVATRSNVTGSRRRGRMSEQNT
jgi:hypothetical protein